MPNPQATALPKLHRLKTDPEVYQAVLAGRKTFEIRLNDRDFHVGDELLLMETVATGEAIKAGAPLQYTGNEMRKRVSHVLSGYGLMPGWVCLSFEAGRAAASGQAGWVSVPMEPTMDMYDAAVLAYQAWSAAEVANSTFTHIDVWNAMLAASPSALAATSASPQAPAPQAVVGEASELRKRLTQRIELYGHDTERVTGSSICRSTCLR
jgi:hypothetical protein